MTRQNQAPVSSRQVRPAQDAHRPLGEAALALASLARQRREARHQLAVGDALAVDGGERLQQRGALRGGHLALAQTKRRQQLRRVQARGTGT